VKKKIAALSVVVLAVLSTGAFAFVDTEFEEVTEEELERGVRVYFVGRAIPRNAEPSTEACCPGLRVTVKAIVASGRAKGVMTVDGRSFDMYARKNDQGIWHGVLINDAGERVGKFRGRYLGQRKVFIGGMKLGDNVYKLLLRRVFLSTAEPVPLAE
jgi:hypothetical protein